MPKPLRRIGANKLATVSEYHASQAMPVVLPVTKRLPQSAHVIERPATGIVLTIASGSRAGEMIGTDDQEVMIGFSHDCLLRFPSDQHPRSRGRLLLRRGTEGWYVLRVSGDSAFVNQHLVEDKFPLRSGDMIRLSARGPDVQFTMHSAGVAIRDLVDRYLPPPCITSQASGDQAADLAQPTATLADNQPVAPATFTPATFTPATVAPAEGAAAEDAAAEDAAAEDAAAENAAASSVVVVATGFMWSDWARGHRSTKMVFALAVAILVLIAIFALL